MARRSWRPHRPRFRGVPKRDVGGSFGPSGRGPLAKQRGWPPALVRGPAQLSHQSLCPTVTKSGNVLRLEVDTQSNQTLGPTRAISAYTLVPLHLGGLPGECGLSW